MDVDEHDQLVDVRWHCRAYLICLVAKEALQVVGANVLQSHVSGQDIQDWAACFIVVSFVYDNIELEEICKLVSIHVIAIQARSHLLAFLQLPQRLLQVPFVGLEEPEQMVVREVVELLGINGNAKVLKQLLLLVTEYVPAHFGILWYNLTLFCFHLFFYNILI